MLTSTTPDCGRGSWLIPHFPVASTVISHGAGVIAPYRSDHTLRAPNIPIGRRLLQTSGRVPRKEVTGAGRSARTSAPTSVRTRGVQSARPPSRCRRSTVFRPLPDPRIRPHTQGPEPLAGVRAAATPLTGGGPFLFPRRHPTPGTPPARPAPGRSTPGPGPHPVPPRQAPEQQPLRSGALCEVAYHHRPALHPRVGPPKRPRTRLLPYFCVNLPTSKVNYALVRALRTLANRGCGPGCSRPPDPPVPTARPAVLAGSPARPVQERDDHRAE